MSKKILDVFLNETFVGKLTQTKHGTLSFVYDPNFVEEAETGISLSLPLQLEPFDHGPVNAYFSGLLPDESVRLRLAKYLGVSEKNPFALLHEVGGDCAGALALYPEGERPPVVANVETEELDDQKLRDILDLIKRRPMLAGDDGYRLSLAGAQDKLAVRFIDGKVSLVKDGAPTTHILKPMIERIEDSAHNEYFCMRLARKVGIDAPIASLHTIGNTPFYIVERFDREWDKDGNVTRIHQEDFCQALGVAPELKYEREGGPSLEDCQQVIRQASKQPAADLIKFHNLVIFNYLIGNADAHGKNFSLLYRSTKPEFAPAYDLMSTAVYPDLSHNMAMKIGKKYKFDEVHMRHWERLVPDTSGAKKAFQKQLMQLSKKTLEASEELRAELKSDGQTSNVIDAICDHIDRRASRLLD